MNTQTTPAPIAPDNGSDEIRACRAPYERPAIMFEGRLEAHAGSPVFTRTLQPYVIGQRRW